MTEMKHASEEDAARAFETLRVEVTELRLGIEQLMRTYHANLPPDYTASLGQITKKLAQLSTQLGKIEQHPALAMTPAIHQQIIAESGGVVMGDAVNRFDHAMQWAERTQQQLAAIVGGVRRRREQRQWLWITAAAALLVGLISAPFVARGLPFELDSRVAAAVMGTDRWNAGSVLMELESPEAWREILAAAALLTSNGAAINACRESAVRAHKPQPCAIVVPPPPTS